MDKDFDKPCVLFCSGRGMEEHISVQGSISSWRKEIPMVHSYTLLHAAFALGNWVFSWVQSSIPCMAYMNLLSLPPEIVLTSPVSALTFT